MSAIPTQGRCSECGFQNPRSWRACARCGHVLRAGTHSGEVRLPPRKHDVPPFRLGDVATTDATARFSLDEATVVLSRPDEVESEEEHVPATLSDVPPPPVDALDVETLDIDLHGFDLSDEVGLDSGLHLLSAPLDGPEAGAGGGPVSSIEILSAAGELALIGQADAANAIQLGIERSFNLGLPTIVALLGPGGSGKSRMLVHASEIGARLDRRVRVLYGAARQGDGPYAPFSRILLDRFGVVPSSSPTAVRGQLLAAISDLLGEGYTARDTTHLVGWAAGIPFPESPVLRSLQGEPEQLHERAVQAIARVFDAEGQRRPLLVLLDDMECAEPEAYAVLAALLETDAHLSIVIAGDESKLPPLLAPIEAPGGYAKGTLAPFSTDDIATYLHVLLPSLVEAPSSLVDAIAHRSEGSPRMVRELILSLAEHGVFVEEPEGLVADVVRLEDPTLPVSSRDAIAGRMQRLDAFELATLERAAVCGPVFWDGALLAQMRAEQREGSSERDLSSWPEEDDADALDHTLSNLQLKGFVEPRQAGDVPVGTAFSIVHPIAREILYGEVEPELRRRRHAAVARWLALASTAGPASLAARIAPHLEAAGDVERAATAHLEAAAYERRRFRQEAACRHYERALQQLATDNVATRLEALRQYGTVLSSLGRDAEAVAPFSEMLELAWLSGARAKGAAALNRIARCHRNLGDDSRAQEICTRALALFRRSGDVRGVAASLDDLAQLAARAGQPDEAERLANESLAVRREHEDRRGESVSLITLGFVALARGRLERAETLLHEAQSLQIAVEDREGMVHTLRGLGAIARLRGELPRARGTLDEALDAARGLGDSRSASLLLLDLAELDLAEEEFEGAHQRGLEAFRLAERRGDRRTLAESSRLLGQVAVARGDDDARRQLDLALELANQYGGPEVRARAHRALGELQARTLFATSSGDGPTAEERLMRSVTLFRDAGIPREAALSLAILGRYFAERGDFQRGQDTLKDARAVFRRLGLAHDAGQVDRMLQVFS